MASTAVPAPIQGGPLLGLNAACQALTQFRQKPLLVLYYPLSAPMTEDDLEDVYEALRAAGTTIENKLPSLDVLVESNGGNPVAGYRLAQLIRDFAADVSFLVADHAYSAATLLCFSGNMVRLAHYAGLSPIDITLVSAEGRTPEESVELANVDNFLEFAKKARETIEGMLQRLGCSAARTSVDSDLLVEMVRQVTALQVGKFFRERVLTGHYAEELLDSYMFPPFKDAEDRRNRVVHHFLFAAPAHEFHIDYHLCQKWGLTVTEMPTAESDLAKGVVATLHGLASNNAICPRLNRYSRLPFSKFYPYMADAAQGAT
jgi:hypothetical protein